MECMHHAVHVPKLVQGPCLALGHGPLELREVQVLSVKSLHTDTAGRREGRREEGSRGAYVAKALRHHSSSRPQASMHMSTPLTKNFIATLRGDTVPSSLAPGTWKRCTSPCPPLPSTPWCFEVTACYHATRHVISKASRARKILDTGSMHSREGDPTYTCPLAQQ